MAKITFEGRPSIKGVLYNIDDSGIYIYSDRTNLPGDSLVNQAAATVYIPAIGIKQIFIRRRGGVGRGALIGAGIGLPVGI
ncbi:MAG: hypothetical protein ABIO46_08415, partial [Chitinophagales bacterium]